jgi:hypothetical protein
MATLVFRIITMAGAIAAFQIVGGRGSGTRLTPNLTSVGATPHAQAPAGAAAGAQGDAGRQAARAAAAASRTVSPGRTPRRESSRQGLVPDSWPRHEGSLLKYPVQIRFGEELSNGGRG